jgi:hypothetical protein
MSEKFNLCESCGSSFKQKQRHQRHCSAACRVRAWRRGKIVINIADMPEDLRDQIARWFYGKGRRMGR